MHNTAPTTLVELIGRPGHRDRLVAIPETARRIPGVGGYWRVVPRRCEWHEPTWPRAIWIATATAGASRKAVA